MSYENSFVNNIHASLKRPRYYKKYNFLFPKKIVCLNQLNNYYQHPGEAAIYPLTFECTQIFIFS